ncbi:unnamed protein product [Allacma fusca]|uniref:Uncharacterized protein n=1 Tax=Allacma fusca TaxID=39272 RepID=A0A8J2KS80_9HEXA|nr:unnamed protein product [Allacma fusca]
MNIIKYSLFVTIVALTSESAWLPDNCFHISEEKGSLSAQRGLDVLPQCTIFLSNNRPLPVISCPAPGIVRFEGEYDYVQINCSASYPLDFKFNGTKPTEAIQVSFRRTVKENSKGEIVLFHADVTVFSIRALHRLYAGSNPNWKQSISKQYQYSRTGGYTFLGFREKAFLKTDFYFFFEEQLASPGFIINREDRKLRWDQFGKIIIPCRATHFNSLVTLEQETNFPALFIYSLTQGFISHQKVTGVHGTFFCRLHDRGNGTVVKYGTQREAPYGYHVKPKDYNVDIQYNVTALPRGHFETKTRCRPSCGTFDCGSNETAVLASISVPNPAMDNLLNDFVLPKFQLRSYTVRVERTQKDINHEIRFENGTLEHFAAAYCGSRDRSKNRSSFGRTLTGIVYPFKYGHGETSFKFSE